MNEQKKAKPNSLSSAQKIVLAVIFTAFAIIGIWLAGDYGVAWDDHSQIEIGRQNYEYAIGISDSIFQSADLYYGCAYELPVYFIQHFFNSFSTQIFVRHLITHFLFLFALYIFFKLLFKLFKSFPLALIGLFILYLSPRIFAHSFFNTKDLPFLSFFIISIFTLWRLSENPKDIKKLIIHAFISGFLIDIRVLGFLIPALTLGTLFLLALPKKEIRLLFKPMLIYGFTTMAFIYILWPAMWSNPVMHLLHALYKMANFPWTSSTLLLGEMVVASNNPWYYIPLWIGISTPIYLLIFYILGLLFLTHDFLKNPDYLENRRKLFILILACIPLDLFIIFLILQPTLYDGWRHLYFLMPLIIIGAIYGIKTLNAILSKNKYLFTISVGLLIIVIVIPVIKMIQLHPYQQVYFNEFISQKDENIRHQFEMDYWGLSYKEGFEEILKIDQRNHIIVMSEDISAMDNWKLSLEIDPRIELVSDIQNADYLITSYRFHPEDYPYKKVYSIRRQGSDILSIYKLKPNQ